MAALMEKLRSSDFPFKKGLWFSVCYQPAVILLPVSKRTSHLTVRWPPPGVFFGPVHSGCCRFFLSFWPKGFLWSCSNNWKKIRVFLKRGQSRQDTSLMKHHVYFSSSVHLPAPPSNSVSAGVDHVSPLPPFPSSHNCGIGPDYIDLRLFHLTHLLAGLSTHHWMLNSIKGNATVIKGLVSQLLLAQAPHALNWNRWRTSGARLNTHSESPKAGRVFFFCFSYIFSLHEPGPRESSARAFIDPEHGPSRAPTSL